jgi:Ca2+-binding RTX toxin-like protein
MKTALAGCMAVAALWAAPADAAVITTVVNRYGGVDYAYVAGPGETNQVHVSAASPGNDSLTIDDPGATIRILNAPGCDAAGSHAVCLVPDSYQFLLGAGNDSFRFDGYYSGVLYPSGGAGDDVLRLEGADGSGAVDGGPGDDRLYAVARTGLIGGPGADVIDGGIDPDPLHYSLPPLAAYDEDTRVRGVHVTLDGVANDGAPGEGDNVLAGVPDVTGTKFGDVIEGSAADNAIYGLGGADEITGGDGSDKIHAGPGADVIELRDGFHDEVDCDRGNDVANLDPWDSVGIDWGGSEPLGAGTCETVTN